MVWLRLPVVRQQVRACRFGLTRRLGEREPRAQRGLFLSSFFFLLIFINFFFFASRVRRERVDLRFTSAIVSASAELMFVVITDSYARRFARRLERHRCVDFESIQKTPNTSL